MMLPSKKVSYSRKCKIPARFVVAFMAFLGTTCIYTMRSNLSVTIIGMVKSKPVIRNNSTNYSNECPASDTQRGRNQTIEGEFDWDEYHKGIALSAFFWGYVCTTIIGGILSDRFSGKLVTAIGTLATSILTLLTPIAARAGIWYLVAVRFLEGLMEGATYSAFYTIISKWCPPNERGFTISVLHLGDGLGTILASPVSAVLMTKSLDGGWPLVFYCFGSMGVLWVILWTILIYESPTVHPRIDEEEKNYILTSLASVTSLERANGNVESEEAKWRIFPWKEALTSPAVWALIAGHIAHTWGFMTLLTELPNYMKTVLHFDTKQSAMLSAVPYIAKMVLSLIVGYLVDLALKNNILSVLNWRRIINTLGNVVPALLFIAVPFIGCNKYGALAALTASAGFQGITSASHLVNNIDIAPNHAGIVHGIMSTPGSLPKILAPYLTGYLTNDSSTIESWSTVFYIAAGFHIVGNFIYVIFARGEPQSWD